MKKSISPFSNFFLLCFIINCFTFQNAQANNIGVSNVALTGNNISFNISWDNSWNSTTNIDPLYPNNWDGAWVFIKYQSTIDNLWKHAPLSTTSANHSVSGGGAILQVDATPDGMGVFIRRTNAGAGNISNATVTLQLEALAGTNPFNFKVFANEVVYVPQSDFQLGDGNYFAGGPNYYIAQDITAAKQATGLPSGSLWATIPAIPTTFPMGYNAFYSMKYEISLEQWVDFLNTLTYDQQANRVPIAPNSAANTLAYTTTASTFNVLKTIRIVTPGLNNTLPAVFGCDFDNNGTYNETTDGLNIAMIGISQQDLMAYLDWSGMRPMTELEYEKACRGTRPRVLNEYSWGSTNYVQFTRTNIVNAGEPNEAPSGVIANGRVVFGHGTNNGVHGPARNGIFAGSNTGRESSGATFYGIMEMTGNVTEICIATDATGAAFNGSHGNGTLTAAGAPDVATWPSTTAIPGYMTRGNSWIAIGSSSTLGAQLQLCQVSYRSVSPNVNRNGAYGGRGVRTAP